MSSRGAKKAAGDDRRAAEDARRFQQNKLDEGLINRLSLFLGPQQAEALARGMMGDRATAFFGREAGAVNPADAEAEIAQIAASLEPFRETRGGSLGRILGALGLGIGGDDHNGWRDNDASAAGVDIPRAMARIRELQEQVKTGRDPGVRGSIDRGAYGNMGPGVVQRMQTMADDFAGRGRESLDLVRGQNNALEENTDLWGGQDLARVQDANGRVMADVDLWGRGREDQIRRQVGEGLTNANDASSADAIAQGLGNSSVAVNARNNNARRFGDVEQGALMDLFDSQSDRKVDARQWAAGRESDQANQFTGQRLNAQQLGDSRESTVFENNISRDYQLQQQPLQTETALYGGGDVNPWLNRDASNFFSNASPQGSGLINSGNALSQLGSTALFAAMSSRGNETPEQRQARLAQAQAQQGG